MTLASILVLGAWRTPAQNPFPFPLGSAGQEYGKCAARSPDGTIVVGILFQNTVDFDGGPGTNRLGTPPGIDCAIVKYDPGGAVAWARHLSGPASGASSTVTITPHGIACDQDGNVYVAGYFGIAGSATAAIVDFDPGPGVNTLTNTGGWDPFLLKLTSTGDFVWARTLGAVIPAATDERLWDVAIDRTGGVYVSGFIQGTYDLDAGPATNAVTSAGEKDNVLVKYDAAGSFVWGFAIPDTGDSSIDLKENSVAVAENGDVWFTGHFHGTIDLAPGAAVSNMTSVGNADTFVARYAPADGTLNAAARIGNTFNDTSPPGTARLGPDGNLYLTGRFRGTLDLDSGPALFTVTNPAATDNIWVASYTTNLSRRWSFSIVSDGGIDGAHRVDFDARGGLYVAGWYGGNADFDPSAAACTLQSTNGAIGSDTFLARYRRDEGTFEWARGFGGIHTNAADLSITAGLAVDDDGAAYVTGQFYGTNATIYDEHGPLAASPAWNSAGNNDAYVIKHAHDGSVWKPTELQTWRQSNFATTANSGTAANGADADFDGVPNLLEHALGGNPRSPASRPEPSAIVTNNTLALVFPRARTGLVYVVEAGADLLLWTNLATDPGTPGTTVTVPDTMPITATNGSRRFLRLRVGER